MPLFNVYRLREPAHLVSVVTRPILCAFVAVRLPYISRRKSVLLADTQMQRVEDTIGPKKPSDVRLLVSQFRIKLSDQEPMVLVQKP